MNDFFVGAVAGAAATVPMTLAMMAMHDELPEHERYPLPPREITEKLTEELGVAHRLSEADHYWLTMLAHYGYGAMAGAIYAPLAPKAPLPAILGGTAFGLAVWTGSYLGLLPALGILTSATDHPPRRTGLMIAAHLVWGASLGLLVSCLKSAQKSSADAA